MLAHTWWERLSWGDDMVMRCYFFATDDVAFYSFRSGQPTEKAMERQIWEVFQNGHGAASEAY